MPKAKEVHDMSNELLVEHVRDTRKEIFGLRFQRATGELENTARLRGARRDLARALTIVRQRGIDLERELRVD
jgi:large subunit ribosomal protein L29